MFSPVSRQFVIHVHVIDTVNIDPRTKPQVY